ncbi:MAG: hypothetical protein JSR99_11860 [Proteobacteria bacterium]|nr:hypothetical protein [Pseudomonadota bacterium]
MADKDGYNDALSHNGYCAHQSKPTSIVLAPASIQNIDVGSDGVGQKVRHPDDQGHRVLLEDPDYAALKREVANNRAAFNARN